LEDEDVVLCRALDAAKKIRVDGSTQGKVEVDVPERDLLAR
jgi:hypothetical protein